MQSFNATDMLADDEQLKFANSAHQKLGLNMQRLEKFKDNAPALVGAMRLGAALLPVAAIALGLDGSEAASHALPFLSIHGAGLVASEAVLLEYGNRKKREAVEEKYKGAPDLEPLQKPLHPARYPLETSAFFDIIGESAMVLGGILMLTGFSNEFVSDLLGTHSHSAVEAVETVAGEDPWYCDMPQHTHENRGLNFSSTPAPAWAAEHDYTLCSPDSVAMQSKPESHLGGLAMILHGLPGVIAHLPILFGQEKGDPHRGIFSEHSDSAEKAKSLTFAKSDSSTIGAIGRAFEATRNNPVAVASALQAAVGISLMIGFAGSWSLVASGAIIAASAVIQGLFVRKRVDLEPPATHIITSQAKNEPLREEQPQITH